MFVSWPGHSINLTLIKRFDVVQEGQNHYIEFEGVDGTKDRAKVESRLHATIAMKGIYNAFRDNQAQFYIHPTRR